MWLRWSMWCVLGALGFAAVFTPLRAGAQSASAEQDDATDGTLSGDEEARMRFQLGRRYYETGRFADAAREFEEAHERSGRVELLYNLFLAYREDGDDERAAEALRGYLASLPPGEERTALEARLRVLDERGARTRTRLARPGRSPARSGAERGEEPTVVGASGGVSDSGGAGEAGDAGDDRGGGGGSALPWVMVGVGGALALGSVVTGLLALDARQSLVDACDPNASPSCPPELEGTRDEGYALALSTDALWITGAVAVSVGVILAVVEASSGDAADASVAGLCTNDGCVAAVSGRF